MDLSVRSFFSDFSKSSEEINCSLQFRRYTTMFRLLIRHYIANVEWKPECIILNIKTFWTFS